MAGLKNGTICDDTAVRRNIRLKNLLEGKQLKQSSMRKRQETCNSLYNYKVDKRSPSSLSSESSDVTKANCLRQRAIADTAR